MEDPSNSCETHHTVLCVMYLCRIRAFCCG